MFVFVVCVCVFVRERERKHVSVWEGGALDGHLSSVCVNPAMMRAKARATHTQAHSQLDWCVYHMNHNPLCSSLRLWQFQRDGKGLFLRHQYHGIVSPH